MNSTQLYFFATEEDYPMFTVFFEAKEAIFVREPVRTQTVEFSYEVRKAVDPEWKRMYFTRKSNAADVFLDYIEKQNYSLVNQDLSLAVAFSIGEYSKETDRLGRSRFYYVKGFWQDGIVVKKDEQFGKWVESIYRSFKKAFLKKGPSGHYYTERALKLMEEKLGVLIRGDTEIQLFM